MRIGGTEGSGSGTVGGTVVAVLGSVEGGWKTSWVFGEPLTKASLCAEDGGGRQHGCGCRHGQVEHNELVARGCDFGACDRYSWFVVVVSVSVD